MSQRTIFLSRLIGLYLILVALFMVTHKQASVEMVTAVIHSPPALFVSGLIGALSGLAIILGHHVWSGGALPVIVTLIGWTALIKGLLLLFLPPDAASTVFLGELHYERFFHIYVAILILLGIYLTSMGWLGRKRAS
jgi:hypothetical protein